MREQMNFDIVIVGAGPAGLSAAIRVKQLCQQHQQELSVCVIEKGSEVGAHILSGAVFEPRALNELIPDWQEKQAPLSVPVTEDHFLFLTEKRCIRLPTPKQMHNKGNYIISLGNLCRWLAKQAEELGVEIYPGFAAVDVVTDKKDKVTGIITGDMGLNKQGQETNQYQAGMALMAKHIMLAEGCRGSLSEKIIAHYNLRQDCDPQTYGIGLKELWEVDSSLHKPGKVVHSVGWPLNNKTYGGSFLYHLNNKQIAVGFVIGLDYANPYLNPFEEMQRFKSHPKIRPLFIGGRRIAYGARCLIEGGIQSLPQCSFPGGVIIGDAAGFLNVPKIKGNHTAMKSAMLAAEYAFDTMTQANSHAIAPLIQRVKKSWLWQELYAARNIRPGFKKGLWLGLVNAAIDTYILCGHAPWTLHNHADHKQTGYARNYQAITYPKPDNEVTFDKLSSIYLSNTNHKEEQPCHLRLKNPEKAISVNYEIYASLEQYYCPAGVYEIIQEDGKPKLQINAANCVHCKCCDIKDPSQNILWVPPEGGDGPNYTNM